MKSYYHLLLYVLLLISAGPSMAQTPSLVKDIFPLAGSSAISNITTLGNSVLFSANNSVNGFELWISDGTEAGTKMVKDIYPVNRDNSSSPTNFLIHNRLAVFEVVVNGKRKLYRTDGTEAGTFEIWDRGYYDFAGGLGVYRTTFLKDTTLYLLTDYPKSNNSLVVKDLSGPGVRLVLDKNLNPNIGNFPLPLGDSQQPLSVFGNRWLFIGTKLNSNIFENTLYVSDETKDGTLPIKLLSGNSSVVSSVTPSGLLGFFVHDDGSSGSELWKTDGTPSGTKMVKNIAPGGLSGVTQSLGIFGYSVPAKNGIVFLADDGVTGQEVWFSDGTETGTQLLKEFSPGKQGSFPSILSLTDDGKPYLYNAGELWRTDGTTAGTKLVTKISILSSSSQIARASDFRKVGDYLYCLSLTSAGSFGIRNYNVIKINTKTDEVIIAGRFTRNEFYINSEFAVTENALFYIGENDDTGYELWKLPLCAHSAKINAPNGASFCPGSSVNIVAEGSGSTGGYTYNWKQGTTNAGTNATLAVNKAGTYTVDITDSKGCTVSTSLAITQTTNLPVTLVGATAVCAGQTTPLSASASGGSGAFSYQWRLNGTVVSGATSSTFVASTAGVYSVSVVDAQGCTGTSANVNVTQKPSPNATISPAGTTAILSNTAVVLSVPTATGQTYQWFRDGQVIAGATNNTYQANQQGNYTVAVSLNGCSATSAPAVITIITALEPGPTGIGMAVSPNPAQDVCRVTILLETAAPVVVQLLDLSGKPVQQWASGKASRSHETMLSLTDLPAGMYLIQATANDRRATAKLLKQ
ncbi:MAG: T9SS type A sorting domain-containing protein [Spirosoma sp.]|nr:T9SS type A sorting domain-containing protein [Spirosoma sp.]